jgi:hypothetical protein
MKKLSIGIQTFSELIEDNYIYVDKTRIIHEMITTGKYYFYLVHAVLENHYSYQR